MLADSDSLRKLSASGRCLPRTMAYVFIVYLTYLCGPNLSNDRHPSEKMLTYINIIDTKWNWIRMNSSCLSST